MLAKDPFPTMLSKGPLPRIIKSRDCVQRVNSLLHDKIQDWSKLKALTDNKIKAPEKSKFVSQRVENIVRKGENAGHQHFLLFPQCLQ